MRRDGGLCFCWRRGAGEAVRMRPLAAGFAVFLGCLGCSGGTPREPNPLVGHILEINFTNAASTGDTSRCSSPLPVGQKILIRDSAGHVVYAGTSQGVGTTALVPIGNDRYDTIEIPRGARTTRATYSRNYLAAHNWTVTLSGC